MTPNKEKVKVERSLTGTVYGYGYSEYLLVTAILPGSLEDYSPENTPSTSSSTISVSSSLAISASYTINTSDLKVISKCNTAKDIFSIEYDYKPSILNIFASNDYVANESIQKGMCIFSVPRNTVGFGFYVNFEYSFGYALTSKILPISIHKGVSRKNKTTFFFEYNVKK